MPTRILLLLFFLLAFATEVGNDGQDGDPFAMKKPSKSHAGITSFYSNANHTFSRKEKYLVEKLMFEKFVKKILDVTANVLTEAEVKMVISDRTLYVLRERAQTKLSEDSGHHSSYDHLALFNIEYIIDSLTLHVNESHSGERAQYGWLRRVVTIFKNGVLSGVKQEILIRLSYFAILVFSVGPLVVILHRTSPFASLGFMLVLQAVLVEWMALYRKALATKLSKYGSTVPVGCQAVHKMSYLSSLMLWLSGAFTFKSDTCQQYHYDILVDPLMEVSVLESFSSALRHFFGNYLLDFMKILNKCVNNLLIGLPIQWQFVLFMTVIFVTCYLVTLYRGISVSLPMMSISVGPQASAKHAHDEAEELRRIQLLRETIKEELSINSQITKADLINSFHDIMNSSRASMDTSTALN